MSCASAYSTKDYLSTRAAQRGTTALALVLALGACATTGSGSFQVGPGNGSGGGAPGSGGSPGPGHSSTPTGAIVNEGGAAVDAVGRTVIQLGEVVENGELPAVFPTTRRDLGQVLVDAGGMVSTVGQGVQAGLGRIGDSNVGDPVGVTLASSGSTVSQVGTTIVSVGALVSNGGSGPLAPLAPATGTVGALLGDAGNAVTGLGGQLGAVLSGPSVQQLTGMASRLIIPLTTLVTGITQGVGAATGLGVPVSQVLGTVGSTVSGFGKNLSAGQQPVLSGGGQVLVHTGNAVSNTGGLVNGGTGSSNPLTGLVGGLLGGPTLAVTANASAGAGVSVTIKP